MNKDYKKEYTRWLNTIEDEEVLSQLKQLNEEEIRQTFGSDLSFGTGGLRAIMSVGTNRINRYTIEKASFGLADYVIDNYKNPSVAIGYDTRIDSEYFAKITADVLSSKGIKVYFFTNALPVSMLSFAIRIYKCSAGVMITASHNSHEYNGYKVYGDDGCQITNNAAKEILNCINNHDYFEQYKADQNLIREIDSTLLDLYINEIQKQSFLYDELINKDLKIVYSPLNGTGLVPVTKALHSSGYNNIIVVPEQEKPDGNFPTCPYPNPEDSRAMKLGIDYAEKNEADIFIASDPDCDRIGVAVKNDDDFILLDSNQLGVLLLNYICEQKYKHHDFGKNPVFMKTIVTTQMAEKVCSKYNIKVINVLTGFKYIGEQITELEKENRLDDFVFAFEESAGFLSGTHVRDKDGVNASHLVCEMFSYYKTQGISLIEKLEQLYQEFGYYRQLQKSYTFKTVDEQNHMNSILEDIRCNNKTITVKDDEVISYYDYKKGIDNLPVSNVLKYVYRSGSFICIRPSGTEPKIKIYVCSSGEDESSCINKADDMLDAVDIIFKGKE